MCRTKPHQEVMNLGGGKFDLFASISIFERAHQPGNNVLNVYAEKKISAIFKAADERKKLPFILNPRTIPSIKGKGHIEVWPLDDLNSLMESVEAIIKGCYPSNTTSFVQASSRPGIPPN